jgi:hypothetical protein
MNKLKLLPLLILIMSSEAFSRTDCPSAKVLNIQIEGSVILYTQENTGWRRLGVLTEPGTKERYAALLAAQMSGRKVMVGYSSDTYNCAITNYSDSAYIVRTYID